MIQLIQDNQDNHENHDYHKIQDHQDNQNNQIRLAHISESTFEFREEEEAHFQIRYCK